MPLLISIVAVLTMSSPPERTSIIWSSTHREQSWFLSMNSTTLPHSRFSSSFTHFCCFCSSLRYFCCQCFQKSWHIFRIRRHEFSRFSATDKTLFSGSIMSACPIKKCAGVKAIGPFGYDETRQSGREFKMTSISIANVLSSSKVKIRSPSTRLKWCLNDFTAASQILRKCGARGGLKWHVIRFVLA